MEELIYFHFLVDCNKKSQECQRKEKECRWEPLEKKSLQRCQEIGLLARTSLVCTYKFKKKRFSIYLSILIYIYILSVRLHSIIDRANKFETSIKCLLGNSKKTTKKTGILHCRISIWSGTPEIRSYQWLKSLRVFILYSLFVN